MRTYAANILFLLTGIALHAQTPLPIPGTLTGPVIDLSLMEGTTEFHAGEVVPTYGYNGGLLGPTVILERNEDVTLNVTNTLPDLTTTRLTPWSIQASIRFMAPLMLVLTHSKGLYSAVGTILVAAAWTT